MFPDLITDDAFRLETRRLWLRWPRVADGVALVKYAGVKSVSRYTTNLPHPYDTKDAETFIMAARKGNADGKQSTLVLTRKEKPGEAIGVITLRNLAAGGLTTAYWLGEPFWRQGLMAEALDEILALGFVATPAPHVRTIVRDGNAPSERLLESRGFKRIETLQVNMPARGGIFPCGKYELPKDEWELRQQDRFSIREPGANARQTPQGEHVQGGSELKICA